MSCSILSVSYIILGARRQLIVFNSNNCSLLHAVFFKKNVLLVLNNILSSLTKIAFLAKQWSKNSGLILMPPPGTGGWWTSPYELFMPLTYPEELWFPESGAWEQRNVLQLHSCLDYPLIWNSWHRWNISAHNRLLPVYIYPNSISCSYPSRTSLLLSLLLHSPRILVLFLSFYFLFIFSFAKPGYGPRGFPLNLYIILLEILLELPFLYFSEYRS